LTRGVRIMNTKHRTYIGVFLVLTVACKDLDLGPKDQISDASFWKSPDQFRLAANDFYYYLQGAHNYTELNSDIAYGDAVRTELRAVSNGSYLAAANSAVWDTNYFNIRATNYLVQKASESGLAAAIPRLTSTPRSVPPSNSLPPVNTPSIPGRVRRATNTCSSCRVTTVRK